jgi:hypothetical protein
MHLLLVVLQARSWRWHDALSWRARQNSAAVSLLACQLLSSICRSALHVLCLLQPQVLPDNLSLEDTALFFARAGAAAYDASIAVWKVKYTTLHWRPITAAAQGAAAASLGAAAADWMPLLRTPPHPEYPSGHQVGFPGSVLRGLWQLQCVTQ